MRRRIALVALMIIGSFISDCTRREKQAMPLDSSLWTQSVPTSEPDPTLTPTPDRVTVPLPLSDTILTRAEVNRQYPSLKGYFGDATDITDELISGNNCMLDCVKHLWPAGQYGPRHLTISLIESDLSSNAQKLVEDTRKLFIDIDDLSDRITFASLPGNAWAAYHSPRHEFVFNYSYGQVFVLVVSQPNENFDDFAAEFDLISLISRLQMEKLHASGYTP